MSNLPYKNPISPLQAYGPQSVARSKTYGTNFSVLGTGGYMEVYNLSDLIYTIPVGQTGSINFTGNTIPVEFTKGGGQVFSPDVLTLNSDNISSGRRRLGMLVYVYEVNKIYQFTIENYDSLWSAATIASGPGGPTVVISNFGTTVKNNSVAGQSLIDSWTASTIEGVSGYTNLDATWRVLQTGGPASGGTSGISGIDGTSGISGLESASGISGVDGTSGISGIEGYSGISGLEGPSGISGLGGDGKSGISGLEGPSGISGLEATSGISGLEATSGISGLEAASGISGIEGYSGISGIEGYSGISGLEGPSGISGLEGPSGVSGLVGTSGISGVSGQSGISGVSGISGQSGISGVSGISGQSGVSGVSGISGISGQSGISGLSGQSGISGISGISGLSGQSGISGISGISGLSGQSGISGISGVSGLSGQSGVSGISGQSGVSGLSGQSGISGISGLSGQSGISGISGLSGQSGISGISGLSGQSGISGVSGLSGQSGISGISGLSGRSGISGISGTDGSSGISGLSGRSGISGLQGTSGISGLQGTSGISGLQGTSGISGISGNSTSGISGLSGLSGVGISGISGLDGNGQSGISGLSGAGTSGISGISGNSTSGISGISGQSGVSGVSGAVGISTGQVYYFNQSVTQTPLTYKQLSTTPLASPQVTVTKNLTGNTNNILISDFITDQLGFAVIPGGVQRFHLHFLKPASNDNIECYVQIDLANSGGTSYGTFTAKTNTALIGWVDAVTPVETLVDLVLPTTTILSTDRMIVRIYTNNTDSTNHNITWYTEGTSYYSFVTTSVGIIGNSGTSGISGISGISGMSGMSGLQGANGVSSSIFYYSANTLSTSGNPGTGYTLWNNATQTASTQLNISHLTNTLTDIDVFLATIAPGQKYIIQDVLDSGNYQIWSVTGTTTNINPNTSSSYWTIPVSISSSLGAGSTNFSNNRQLFIAIQGGTSGISGQSGVSGNVGGGISWVNALTTQSMVANTGYVTTASTLTTLTLPTTISLGQTLEVVGYGTGFWRLNQNSNQFIKFGNTGTTTTSGILSATSAGDSVRMTCVSANTAFVITSSIGNVFFS